MKTCSKCGEEKAPTSANFNRSTTTRDKWRPECKECQSLYHRSYAALRKPKLQTYFRTYYHDNSETIKQRSRQRELANPEAAQQRKRASYEQSAEMIKERERQRYAANRTERQSQQREYHRTHPHMAKVASQRRRSRLANLPADFTVANWKRALDYFENRCATCRDKCQLVMDHWMPVSLGGSTTRDNIVPLCSACNSSKFNHNAQTWLKRRFGTQAESIGANIAEYLTQTGNHQ